MQKERGGIVQRLSSQIEWDSFKYRSISKSAMASYHQDKSAIAKMYDTFALNVGARPMKRRSCVHDLDLDVCFHADANDPIRY